MTHFKLVSLLSAVLLTATFIISPGVFGDKGRYDRLFIVPVPGPVIIDGRLGKDEWDISGQIELYVVPETAASQSAKFAVMYDDEALYLSGVVRDTSPMMNRHDPEASGNVGWDADAAQFRIVLDAESGYPSTASVYNLVGATRAEQQKNDTRDDIVHLTLWNYTDRQEANLQMNLGMSYRVPSAWAPYGVVPRDLFEGEYVESEDGLGYSFEYRIPWSTLGAKEPLKGGDLVAGTVQFNWSRPDGLNTAGGAAWAYDVLNSPGFPFQVSSVWGKLIFTEEGDIPRELVDAGLPPEKPLPLTFEYDVPEDSELTVQLVDQDNMVVRTIVAQGKRNAGRTIEKWDGLDDQGKPLPAGIYNWRGIYHEPIELEWRFSVHNSGQPPYPTPDNTGGWGSDHSVPTDVIALPDGLLLAWEGCEFGWGIIRVDNHGKKLWGSKASASHLATDGERFFAIDYHGFNKAPGVTVFDLKDSRPTTFAGKPYASLELTGDIDQDHMSGLAYTDGKLYIAYENRDLIGVFDAYNAEILGTIKLPHPKNLAVRPNGSVLALSGDKLVAIDNEKVIPFASAHLDHPQGLAVAEDGAVYVANRGKLMNVSVFDASGKYLKSIGKAGGRNAIGAYQPKGMFMPAGLAISSDGYLWVAEHADFPKRMSKWDTETGENIDEFFGGSAYHGYAYIDPARPDEVYGNNTIWKVDWDTYTTMPVSTIWRGPTPYAPNRMMDIAEDGYVGVLKVFTREDGNQFAYGRNYASTILAMRKGDIFQPIAAGFHIGRGGNWYRGEQFELLKDEERYPNGNYFWQDQNDDGIVQHEEIDRVEIDWYSPGFKAIDPQTMDIWMNYGAMLKPHAITPAGRPIYRIEDLEKTFLADHPNRAGDQYLWLDPDGSIYTFVYKQRPSWTKWSPEGEMLVGYPDLINWPEALGLPPIKAGRLYGMAGPLGVAGDFTGNMTYFGVNHLFMRDGTYVAALGYDGRIGGEPALQGQPEGQGGQIAKLDIDGEDRYFLLHGGQDGRVIEILGLDTIKPLAGGSYEISETNAADAAQALAEYNAAIAKMGGLTIGRQKSSLDVAKTVGKDLEGTRGFKTALAYDNENLYAKYTVKADHPLLNAQPDPRIIFKGGNLIDIQLATNADADPDRDKPAVGDLRLLVSRDAKGQTRAVLFQPRVADFEGDRIVLKSPTGEEPFDAITDVSDKIDVDYEENMTGFVATVTIPLDLIGFAPEPGQQVKADLGYIFGNEAGTRAMIRAYWINNGFSANVVDDIPNESRLEPHEWGQANVE